MKQLLSLVLCIALLLSVAGCAATQPPVPPTGPSESQPALEVFDDSSLSSFDSSFAFERPAINADVSLPGPVKDIDEESVALAEVAAADVEAVPVAVPTAGQLKEIRSIWLSYLDLDPLVRGKTKSQFTANISAVFDNLEDMGFNTVIVHVRPFGDALYNSEYFPYSYILTGTEGKDPGFDPLAVMVSEAHRRDLRIEAWINPYRVRAAASKNPLSSDNQAQVWLDSGSKSVIKYGDVISYNPASKEAQALIVNGVREIVRNYDVDAIHIDDYFYPTTDAAFDKSSYDSYVNGGGKLSLSNWRRSNVETLIKKIYAAVKEEKSTVLFGISPASNIQTNYDVQYLDVAKIVTNTGYCDYVCPQVYFGYENAIQPFASTLKQWDDLISISTIDMYVGIAAYKVGMVDSWAGSGKDEWVNKTGLLSKMVTTARTHSNYKGFVVYRYDSLFNPAASVSAKVEAEKSALAKLMTD